MTRDRRALGRAKYQGAANFADLKKSWDNNPTGGNKSMTKEQVFHGP